MISLLPLGYSLTTRVTAAVPVVAEGVITLPLVLSLITDRSAATAVVVPAAVVSDPP